MHCFVLVRASATKGTEYQQQSLPSVPSLTLVEKKESSGTMLESTYAYSSTLLSPLRPRKQASANSAPAYAIDNVAEP